MTQTIILTGFMGTGKSTIGRLLAERLNRPFVDTDDLIEQRSGKPISAIFADDGEATFRAWEATIARELAAANNLVVATGGAFLPIRTMWRCCSQKRQSSVCRPKRAPFTTASRIIRIVPCLLSLIRPGASLNCSPHAAHCTINSHKSIRRANHLRQSLRKSCHLLQLIGR
ncbi:MAG: hypothetical protein M9928_14730 [Anaerolineae bacterium]|nr:hypothetical protein [Anaerolineae bacterium]